MRSTSSPQAPMSGRRTAEAPKSRSCTFPKSQFQNRATLKKMISISAGPIDPDKSFRASSKRVARFAVKWLGPALGGAVGLKNPSLAYVSKVGFPELHLAGRPPKKSTTSDRVAGAGERRGVWRCDGLGLSWAAQWA